MTVHVHIWSDYVCPFCLITDELVARAAAGRTDVEIEHHPHELRPYPARTLRPEDPYLPGVWTSTVYPMARRLGVPMALPTVSPQPRTELAFRGFRYASDRGVANAYHRRVLTAFFRDDLDIGDRGVLVRLAQDVGLDPAGFTAALDDPSYARRHRDALAEAERLGITVVPTVFVGGRRLEGVVTENALHRAFDEVVAA
ncbi:MULTISPECIES: DsbA family oxidoreductase [Prauserella salsuginis group]|uniref:DsbA family protein n=2 Tax=Prauserella salsuginis group TaxID=2893672 RepID=A0ABW6G605_9PSEU|nr:MULTISPECIES: DsbA family protein [Prauserella salsuginis group]MBB3661313.1 putative DsbA family dithiol-disulfide isomerase [Prauserella sediminis]MCR3719235.1 putative dithiol-disulfide isomerase, DsbA family [Prauserella flava]MCR3735752.1 putative dithiol-disulfide isomerase, DsbA family [Prauserella salsuginis]